MRLFDIWLVWKVDDRFTSTPRMLQREYLHLRLAADTGLIAHGVPVVPPSRANHGVQQTTQIVAQEKRSTYRHGSSALFAALGAHDTSTGLTRGLEIRYKVEVWWEPACRRVKNASYSHFTHSTPKDCGMTSCLLPPAISFLLILVFGAGICAALHVLFARRSPLTRTRNRGNGVSWGSP